ncbi:MAG: peptidoglycan-binding domain-containing protein [Polyangiaceae bacterium]
MPPYVIKQGDYLTKIAHELAFDPDAVWNDDKNAALRARRPNRDILYPGDILEIPDAEPNSAGVQQGTSNEYTAGVPKVKISVVLEGPEGPLANEPFTIVGLAETSGTTDGNGEVNVEIPVDVKEFTITLTQQEYAYTILVGHLDPPTEDSGIRQRLTNLGIYRRASPSEDGGALRAAIREFQRQHSLPITGIVDDATREAIVAAHGA